MAEISDIYKVKIYYRKESKEYKSRLVLIINKGENNEVCTIVEII